MSSKEVGFARGIFERIARVQFNSLDILPPLAEIFISSSLETAFESLKFTARKRFFRIRRVWNLFSFLSRRPRIEPVSLENDGSLSKSLVQDSRGCTDEIPETMIQRILLLFFFFLRAREEFEKVASMESETKAVECFKLLTNS